MDLAAARRAIRDQPSLNAFISLTSEEGRGPVVAVKDLIDVRGAVTTGGGCFLPARPADADAACLAGARALGAVVIGKTNLDEFAYGATGENEHHGPVRNARDPRRMAGGSSAGSAVAVAAGMCDWAVGTDTGGSIRIPAALNGVVGCKPSRGLVSVDGVIPLSPTLDTVGPIAPDVTGAARALEALAGVGGLVPARPRSADQLRIAVPEGWVDDLDPGTAAAWRRVSAGLPAIRFPARDAIARVYRVILLVEALRVHERWLDEHADRYGATTLARLQAGGSIPDGDYRSAIVEAGRLAADAVAAMADHDALLLPAVPLTAPLLGDASAAARLPELTRAFNVTGQPAVTLPAPNGGLPAGVQVVGRPGVDGHVIEVALALEHAWRADAGR